MLRATCFSLRGASSFRAAYLEDRPEKRKLILQCFVKAGTTGLPSRDGKGADQGNRSPIVAARIANAAAIMNDYDCMAKACGGTALTCLGLFHILVADGKVVASRGVVYDRPVRDSIEGPRVT